MRNLKWKGAFPCCILAAVLVFSGCVPAKEPAVTAPSTRPEEPSETASGPAPERGMPSVRLEARDVPLAPAVALEEGETLEVLWACPDRVLYAIQSRRQGDAQTNARFETRQLGLFDLASGAVSESWTPEAGKQVLSGVCAGPRVCYLAAELEGDGMPQGFNVNIYSGGQITAVEQGAPWIQDLTVLRDGTAVYSFCQETGGAFGVRAVRPDGQVQQICQWQAGEDNEPLAGALSAYGDSFLLALRLDGDFVLLEGTVEGESARYPLKLGTEKLDSFCLTQSGPVACLSVAEQTPEAKRQLVLFPQTGDPIRLDRAASDALYRMTCNGCFILAVDSNYRLYLVYPGKDRVACQLLSLSELGEEELDGMPVQLWPDDEMGFFCYFPDSMWLLRLTAAPAA